jgi:hypothetical protein
MTLEHGKLFQLNSAVKREINKEQEGIYESETSKDQEGIYEREVFNRKKGI